MSRFKRTGWEAMAPPSLILALSPTIRAYQKDVIDGQLRVFVGEENAVRWHLSISHNVDGHPGRYPTWDEIRDARYEFCPPAATMAMLLPPRGEYVNAHDTTFHLWQTEETPS